jgi:hypothetical protein
MANAGHDQNARPTMICASSADGVTIVPLYVNVSNNNGLMIDDNTTGSDNGNNGGNAIVDENSVSVLTALSSNGDGSIVEIYGLNNKILINSL